jgi:hypothetical protein
MYRNEEAVGEGLARLGRAARRGLHHHQGLVERPARARLRAFDPESIEKLKVRTSICC